LMHSWPQRFGWHRSFISTAILIVPGRFGPHKNISGVIGQPALDLEHERVRIEVHVPYGLDELVRGVLLP